MKHCPNNTVWARNKEHASKHGPKPRGHVPSQSSEKGHLQDLTGEGMSQLSTGRGGEDRPSRSESQFASPPFCGPLGFRYVQLNAALIAKTVSLCSVEGL